MSNYNNLKSSINNNIYENQTQQITGTVLNAILNEMTNALGAGYQFAGVATVGMTPSEPDARIFYLAGEGIYTSFDGIQVPAGKLGILKWDSRWHLETIDGLGSGGANLTGYVTVASTDDLPDEGVATLGYLCGENLYLYVGEGGDTKEGKYQDCGSFRGPQGDSVQDVEQTQTSLENGGVNKIKFTLSNGISCEFQVRNGTTSSGLFPNLAALQAAHPSPVVGQYAFVGAGFPADIYVCTTAGTWTDSGEDYDGDNVDLTDYATKAEVNQLEAKVDDIDDKIEGTFYKADAQYFTEYNGSIAELYFTKTALENVASLDFRSYGGTSIYAYARNSNAVVIWKIEGMSIMSNVNGDIIPLVATSGGGNISVGDIVGYVLFSDIASFRGNSSTSSSLNQLNIPYVSRIQNAPAIAEKIHLGEPPFFLYDSGIAATTGVYENCITELYLNKSILGRGEINFVSVSNYAGALYLYFKKTRTGSSVWTSNRGIVGCSNGQIIPIVITTAGAGVSLGEVVGFIIFSDIATFRATNYGSTSAYVNIEKVTSPEYSPIIASSANITVTNLTNSVNCPKYRIGVANTNIPAYESSIRELWVKNDVVNGEPLIFKSFGGSLYLYTYNGGVHWQSIVNLSNHTNGEIIPLAITTPYGDAKLGDVVGYVIFSDIASFVAIRDDSTKSAVLEPTVVFRLESNPTIWNHLIISPEDVKNEVHNGLVGDFEIVLPSVIYAAVGVQLNIYNDTIAVSMDKGLISPTNYIVGWSCAKGTITGRAFRFTPVVGDIGNVSLTCKVYNVAGTLVATKTCTIKVVTASIASAKRVVFFGDSTGAGSASALYADFNDAGLFSGTKPTMLGVRGNTPKYEAFGGARWADYATEGRAAYRCQVSGVGAIALNSQYTNNGFTWRVVEVNVTEGVGNILITKDDLYSSLDAPETNGTLVPVVSGDNIAYTGATKESGNPLWHNNAIDFSHYRNTLGLGANDKLDLVSFQLGLNGREDNATLRQYIIDLYTAAVADNANCIFLIGLVTGPCNTVDAYGANYGAGDWMATIRRYHAKRKVYEELVESGDYPNMRIATPNLSIDRYYGFPLGTRVVSARNNTQEEYHTNFVHPSESGYAQIGDAFFAAYIATLNE